MGFISFVNNGMSSMFLEKSKVKIKFVFTLKTIYHLHCLTINSYRHDISLNYVGKYISKYKFEQLPILVSNYANAFEKKVYWTLFLHTFGNKICIETVGKIR